MPSLLPDVAASLTRAWHVCRVHKESIHLFGPMQMRTGQASEEDVKQRRARAMQDPEVQRILTDPVMQQVRQPSLPEHVILKTGRNVSVLLDTLYSRVFQGLSLCAHLGENLKLGKEHAPRFVRKRD